MFLARPQITRTSQFICSSCARRQRFFSFSRGGSISTQKRSITQNWIRKTEEAAYQWCKQAQRIRAGEQKSVLSILEERGFVNSVVGARDDLDRLMIDKRIGAYVGIDPTAPSLHVGHLVPLMALFWMYIHGLHAVSVLGGSTARVGDPSGRSTSREDQPNTIRRANIANMHIQLKKLWDRVENHSRKYGYIWEWAWHRELVNNNTWLQRLSITELLLFLGSGVRIGPMLGRDSARERMKSGQGMSLGEFLYPVLQSWDWWHMYHTKGIQVQIGGSDQYGNIVAGMDAIKYINKTHHNPDHRQEKEEFLNTPMGLTVPLLKSGSGEKFGKSLGNAIWLDRDMTSTFDLYQFFVRTTDEDVGRYLKLFTFIPTEEIEKIVEDHKMKPSNRLAQHRLAYEVVEFVHGEQLAMETQQQHQMVFRIPAASKATEPVANEHVNTTGPSDPLSTPNRHSKPVTSSNAPPPNLILPESLVYNQSMACLLYHAGLADSLSDAHRLGVSGAAHIASLPGQKKPMGDKLEFTLAANWHPSETEKFIIDGDTIILRVGKWNVKIIKIISDEEFEQRGLTAPGWNVDTKLKESLGDLVPSLDQPLFKSNEEEIVILSQYDKNGRRRAGPVNRVYKKDQEKARLRKLKNSSTNLDASWADK